MKKLLLAVFVFAALFTAQVQPAYACSCVIPGTPEEELEKSDAVFRGEVAKIESADYGYDVTILVTEILKGLEENTIATYVHTGMGGGDCGFNFEEGKVYLVYASLVEGEYEVYSCSLTSLEGDGGFLASQEQFQDEENARFIIFLTGLISSIVLVIGSAWPDPKKNVKPARTFKHWIFGIGNFGMLAYATLAFYFTANPVFFVLLEILCAASSVLILANVKEKISTRLILVSALALLVWSFFLFEDSTTVFFILGLSAVAVGFTSKNNVKRNAVFVLGCILISTFSFIKGDMIFFWLNAVFGLFSGFYLLKALRKR